MNPFNILIVRIVQLLPKPVVGFFSKKYIAGETLQEAVDFVKKLNVKGIYATMDVLGESVANKEDMNLYKQKIKHSKFWMQSIKTNY